MELENKKILIVDDEPENLQAIADNLAHGERQYEILKAPNGEIALKIIERRTPDLIITDWEMPKMDGLELIKHLKSLPNTKDIPIIMCTGVMTSPESLEIALKAGAVDYVRKPVDKIELQARVHSMMYLSESYKQIKKQKKELVLEKNKTEKLLLNILPKSIMNDLKESGKTSPDVYNDVSVLFSDFVGFTELSSKIEVQTLIDELNDLFTSFDIIMEKYDCERIKTIGDTYLAVCGMPETNENHAENLVRAAIEIINYLKKRNSGNTIQWNIRIGINSGKVTGGVVGIKKYIYDVFGDTINVASRMESNSKPMRINISENTHRLIADKFNFEKRESQIIKGLGETTMYFIND